MITLKSSAGVAKVESSDGDITKNHITGIVVSLSQTLLDIKNADYIGKTPTQLRAIYDMLKEARDIVEDIHV
jgi:hypothetical protein